MEPKPTTYKNAAYHSYLIRLWRNGLTEPWRASLHNALTGEQHHFADPVQLFYFLQLQLAGEGQYYHDIDLGNSKEIMIPLP